MNNREKIKTNLYHQTPLRILSFLSNYPGQVFAANEVAKETGCSKGTTNQTLRLLLQLDMVFREKKGNLYLYKINGDNFVLKQFKIFENLLNLQDLIKKIRKYCFEIVLFGSRADGSNSEDSDIDLYLCTEHKAEVEKIINKYEHTDTRYQVIILDPLETASSKKEDDVFHKQVKKGVVLWKGKPVYEER